MPKHTMPKQRTMPPHQMDESQDETLRRGEHRNAVSLSRARQQQGHVAHQRVRSNRRVGDQNEDVQFEERPTPCGQNTYVHELTPEDGHISPGADGRLRRRRAKNALRM